MADKRKVQRNIQRIKRVKTWQLIILLLLAGIVSATFLRLNNIGMIERRTAVLQADKHGDVQAITNNLFALQRWSSSKMNASTGVFYLENSYDRDVKDISNRASTSNNNMADVVKKADKVCKQQYGGYSQAYAQCFANEQNKHTNGSSKLETPDMPNPNLYRHEYTSPLWSPDFAGWSLLVCGLIVLIIIFRMISLVILKILLRKHYTSI